MRSDAALRWLLVLTFAAALAVNIWPVFRPLLVGDDLEIIVRSWTWERTAATLWEPQNEHAMPLGRLSTRGLVLLAGRPTRLPLAVALQGPIAQLAALALVYLFIRRERNDRGLALLAMLLFGVTSLYHQAISWFAASFSLLALDTLLVALLAAQAWQRTGRRRWLIACFLATALAPAWFASGILAGPLVSLYFLLSPPHENKSKIENRKSKILDPYLLVPLLGTAAFLAVSLPRTAARIQHLEHYYGRTATASFHLGTGAWYTARSLVDNLLLGQFGISGVRCPPWLLPLGWIALAALGVWWWRRAPRRGLLVLGLAFIFSSYLLVYAARAGWDYDAYNFSSPTWGRYHLLPQLGLALYVVGGLPAGMAGSQRFVRWTCILLAGLTLVNLPRVIIQHCYRDPSAQQAVLRQIEETDGRCRDLGIDAATAKEALGWKEIPDASSKENGWDLLRGSDSPRAIPVEEARRLLTAGSE